MDPKPAVCLQDPRDQVLQAVAAALVPADHHAGEDDLPEPGTDKPSEFIDYLRNGLAPRGAPHQGDDAVGTEVVAPVLDFQIYAAGGRPERRREPEPRVGRGLKALKYAPVRDQVRYHELVVIGEIIDVPFHRGPFGDAPGNDDPGPRSPGRGFRRPVRQAPGLPLAPEGDRARVDDEQVRVVRLSYRVAHILKNGGNRLYLGLVETASQG